MANDEQEWEELKALYDELWKDGRSLIRDLNKSVQLCVIAGTLLLIIAIMTMGTAISGWLDVFAGSARPVDYLYAIGGTVGIVFNLAASGYLFREYFILRKRYARLLQMEKASGA